VADATAIRPAALGDAAAIRTVVHAAFAREDEAALVERLRHDGAVLAELVATDGAAAVVGHVLFSAVPVAADGADAVIPAAALAPLAVLPEHQRRGVGAALVTAGLEACRARGVAAVLVLGDPAYYRRFGFAAEAARGLRTPFAGPAFMALELIPGALARGGVVRYPAAFGV
jgi:putative acetyltransferase